MNSDKIWTLKLIYIVGKADATNFKNLIANNLTEYGLDMEKTLLHV